MRTLWTAVAALALSLGAGCKNDHDRAADKMSKARDDVKDQQKDVNKAEQRESEARHDMQQQQRELGNARDNLAQARTQYTTDVRDRLSRIDTRIRELDASTDAKDRDRAARARVRRDEISQRLDMATNTTSDQWDSYRKDVDKSLDSLDKDLDIKK